MANEYSMPHYGPPLAESCQIPKDLPGAKRQLRPEITQQCRLTAALPEKPGPPEPIAVFRL